MASVTCPHCGAGLESGARFCGVCGHRLEDAGVGAAAQPARASSVASASAGPGAAADRAAGPPPRGPTSALRPGPMSALSLAMSGVGAGEARDPFLGASLNNRFVVEDKLGEGGFGAVYRGSQVGTGRKVAIKLLHPEMTRDQNVVARFRREGQVLCSLRDAHTITTYDFDQTPDGTLFIAMELLEGMSLHDIFHNEAPIAWHRMLKIMSEMCSSLEEAHSLGIVHRDLKPENIYLESRPGNPEFVKILDFGIAKVMRGEGITGDMSPQLTATGQTLGTLEYMSPEQLMGKPLDGRSDIYGLGVVAFEMMTGQLPFPDAVGPAALISAQLKKIPPTPSSVQQGTGIPELVDQLVLKMLAKDKNSRFRDVTDLRREIDGILATGGLGASAAPPAYGSLAPGQPGHPGLAGNPAFAAGPPSSVQPPAPAPAAAPAAPAQPPAPRDRRPAPGEPAWVRSDRDGGPGATDSIIRAATASRRWVWLAVLALIVVGGAVGAILASR